MANQQSMSFINYLIEEYDRDLGKMDEPDAVLMFLLKRIRKNPALYPELLADLIEYSDQWEREYDAENKEFMAMVNHVIGETKPS